MRRTAAFALAIGLSVSGLAACSAQSDAYCNVLKQGNALSLEQVNPSDPKAFKQLTDQIVKAEDAAPDDVKSHWQAMSKAMEQVSDAMENPADADQAALQRAATNAQEAAEALQADAKERCGIDA